MHASGVYVVVTDAVDLALAGLASSVGDGEAESLGKFFGDLGHNGGLAHSRGPAEDKGSRRHLEFAVKSTLC